MMLPGARTLETLVVVAHPDDEALFFAPAVLACGARGGGGGGGVRVLCLSTGDADGLGALRASELRGSCATLGVAPSGVACADAPDLRDGFGEDWAPGAVCRELDAARRRWPGLRRVVTFDARGVSGHPNHTATHRGVVAWLGRGGAGLAAWQLRSEPLWYKFLGPVGCLCSRLSAPPGATQLWAPSATRVVRACLAHRTQMVWYRYLFLLFSTYTHACTLVPLALPPGDGYG